MDKKPTVEPTPNSEEENSGFLEKTGSVVKDVVQGVVDTAGNAPSYIAEGVAETGHFLGLVDDQQISKARQMFSQTRDIARDHEKTATEEVIAPVVQLAGPGGVYFKALQKAGVATKSAALIAEVVAGATAINPGTEALSNLLPEDGNSEVLHTIRDILATDPSDPKWANRARHAAEIVTMGFAVDRMLGLFRREARANTHNGEGNEGDLVATTETDEGVVKLPNAESDLDVDELLSVIEENKTAGTNYADASTEFPLNLDKIDEPSETKAYLESMVDELPSDMRGDWTDVRTLEETNAMGEELLKDKKQLVQYAQIDAKTAKVIDARLNALRKLYLKSAADLSHKAFWATTRGTPADRLAYEKSFKLTGEVLDMTKQIQRGSARAVSQGRIDVSTGGDLENLYVALREGDLDAEEFMSRAARLKDEPSKFRKLLKAVFDNKAWKVTNEIYINSLLSGPKTHLVNITSNALETVVKPLEAVVGGTLVGNKTAVKEGLSMYMGQAIAFKDAVTAMKYSFKNESPALDALNMTNDFASTVDEKVIKGAIGQALRLPSRLLLASDEFFKQVNYRAARYAEGVLKLPDGLTSEQRASWLQEYVEKGFDPLTGRGTDPKALRYAREATFTEPLEVGTLGRSVQNMVNDFPALRVIMPFTRTPINLLKHQFRRMPVTSMLSKSNWDAIAAGGKRRAEAIGRMSVGMTVGGAAFTLATEDRITGSGPVDPALKSQLMDTGWKPYSMVFTNEDGTKEYVPFNRLDPRIAGFFSIAADIWSVSGATSAAQEDETLAAVALAFSNSVTDKTFLSGVSDLMTALSSNNQKPIERYLANVATGHIPYSAFMRQVNQDPYLREINGIIDGIKANIPGYSTTLEPRRNIFGEPVLKSAGIGLDAMNPFHSSTLTHETVKRELFAIGQAGGTVFSRPSKMRGGVDLSEIKTARGRSLYDVFQERTGTIARNSKTLKEALSDLVTSDTYFNADDKDDPVLERSAMVSEVIGRYREAAFMEMKRDYPNLEDALRFQMRENKMQEIMKNYFK